LYLRARLRRSWDFLTWEIPHGLKNLWRFRKVVWDFSDGDYSSLLKVMQVASKELSNHIGHHNHHQRAKKDARELLIVSELCRRLATEDQYDVWLRDGVKRGVGKSKRYFDHYQYLWKQDHEYLMKMFKSLPHWWC
jgi:hypothetical protein